jgi:periplasmic protein CpxP/Spy
MHTKTIFMLLGAVLSTGVMLAQAPDQAPSPSAAQPTQNDQAHPHHAANPDRMAKHLSKKLGLSSEQQSQIKPVLQDRVQKMQALRSDASLSQQDRRSKAREIMQESDQKIEAVLNDTQKQQFEQMRQERRTHHKAQPQG